MTEKYFMTWCEYFKLRKQIVDQIRTTIQPPYNFVAMMNGGYIFTTDLSIALSDSAPVQQIKISRYDGETVRKVPIFEGDFDAINEGCIIVDDLVDTGNTIKLFNDAKKWTLGKEYKLITLHYRPNEVNIVPTIYGKKLKNESWIVYPWEGVENA
jgi:hypoxanthine phosphoribosyltransferase